MGKQRLVRRSLVRRGGKPDDVENGRCVGRHGRLQKREPDVAQSAAMIGRMMVLVLEGKGGELRGGERADHQDDE